MTEIQPAVFAQLIASLGLAALVALAYSALLRSPLRETYRSPLAGLLFGLAAIASMMNPIVFAPGLLIDSRGVMVALSAPFGGWIAGIVTTVTAGAFRYLEGGMGAVAGFFGILGCGLSGIVFARLSSDRRRTGHFIVLGIFAATFQILGFFVLPLDTATMLVEAFALPLGAINIAGVIVVGSFLRWEETRVTAMRQMQNAARTDWLTQLSNRRRLEEIARALQDRRAKGNRLAAVLFDIDCFKQVNDSYGHPAGDAVLSSIASRLRENTRKVDDVLRYGGEEFVVLMRDSDLDQATRFAERVRADIEAMTTDHGADRIQVTVSAGVACTSTATSPSALEKLLRDADQALYRAKKEGRNRVVATKSSAAVPAA